jgi:hypothetical protein
VPVVFIIIRKRLILAVRKATLLRTVFHSSIVRQVVILFTGDITSFAFVMVMEAAGSSTVKVRRGVLSLVKPAAGEVIVTVGGAAKEARGVKNEESRRKQEKRKSWTE